MKRWRRISRWMPYSCWQYSMRKRNRTLLDSNYEHLERIPAGAITLEGTLSKPADARGIALFPYNIESEQRISYTTGLAELMRRSGLATLLVNLLTTEEKALDAQTGFFRENIDV